MVSQARQAVRALIGQLLSLRKLATESILYADVAVADVCGQI